MGLRHDLIKGNLAVLRRRINEACRVAGRNPDDVTLVAVSKTVNSAAAADAVRAGVTDLGENRAAEIIAKHRLIGDKVKWHFIGHLQRNKVKKIIRFVDLIHSVDSLLLAREIDKRAREIAKVQPILLEVNITGEPGKYGATPAAARDLAAAAAKLANLRLDGLMTMAPLSASKEQAGRVFSALRALRDELSRSGFALPHLSMGMTDDFEAAIKEGADIIRIGRAVFN